MPKFFKLELPDDHALKYSEPSGEEINVTSIVVVVTGGLAFFKTSEGFDENSEMWLPIRMLPEGLLEKNNDILRYSLETHESYGEQSEEQLEFQKKLESVFDIPIPQQFEVVRTCNMGNIDEYLRLESEFIHKLYQTFDSMEELMCSARLGGSEWSNWEKVRKNIIEYRIPDLSPDNDISSLLLINRDPGHSGKSAQLKPHEKKVYGNGQKRQKELKRVHKKATGIEGTAIAASKEKSEQLESGSIADFVTWLTPQLSREAVKEARKSSSRRLRGS